MRHRYGVPLLLALLVLSGCINYEEEITLRRNGSGFARIHYSIQEDMATVLDNVAGRLKADPTLKQKFTGQIGPIFSKAGAREVFADKPDIILERVEEETKDGVRHVYVDFGFRTLKALNDLFGFNNGSVALHDLTGDRLEYMREIGNFSGMGSEAVQYPAFPPLLQAAKTCRLKFTLHLPGKVLESNARQVRGSTAVWECPIAEIKDISTMTAIVAPPYHPLCLLLVGGIVLLATLVLIRFAIGKKPPQNAA